MGVRRVSQYSHMLLQLLDLCLENGDLALLRFSLLHNFLQIFVKNFIFISLRLDVRLELFVIFPGLLMQVVLDHFSFFNKNIHHDIYFFPDAVSLFLEQLQEVVPCNQLVLQSFDLFVHRG